MSVLALQGKTNDELLAIIARMQVASQRKISLKVTAPKLDEKSGEMKGTSGAISLYGLGKFPITLYRSQWERLIAETGAITQFIADNSHLLATKD